MSSMGDKSVTRSEPLSFVKERFGWVGDTSNIDVSCISGNVDKEVKQACFAIFRFFTESPEKQVYGDQIGKRLKLAEVNVWGEGGACNSQTIVEIVVEQDMCNAAGVLHGACGAYIVDPCTVSSLIVLGIKLGVDGTGFSQSMNIIWHHPAKRGAKLKIISTAMSMRGRIRTTRCEIWDRDTLCITALHSTMSPEAFRAKLGRL